MEVPSVYLLCRKLTEKLVYKLEESTNVEVPWSKRCAISIPVSFIESTTNFDPFLLLMTSIQAGDPSISNPKVNQHFIYGSFNSIPPLNTLIGTTNSNPQRPIIRAI